MRCLTSMATMRVCPRCRVPVTFGGGMTMTNFSALLSSLGLKKPQCSHQAYLRSQYQDRTFLARGH